jgi:hypothetical protein
MLDDVALNKAESSLGTNSPPKLIIQNVDISVRPEIILVDEGKGGKPLAGALKLHFPRTFPLGDSGAGYVSALLQEYTKTYLTANGEASGALCPVIDVGSKKMYPGAKSILQRMKDIEAACRNIAGLWPTITADD